MIMQPMKQGLDQIRWERVYIISQDSGNRKKLLQSGSTKDRSIA